MTEKHIHGDSLIHLMQWLHKAYSMIIALGIKEYVKQCMKRVQKRAYSTSHRIEIAYKSKYHCHMCKMLLPPTFEVDHIVELCDGGKDEYSNLQALCPIIVMHWRPVRTSYVEIKHLRRNLERDLIWCKPIHLKSLSINLNNLSIFHRENIRSLLLY